MRLRRGGRGIGDAFWPLGGGVMREEGGQLMILQLGAINNTPQITLNQNFDAQNLKNYHFYNSRWILLLRMKGIQL